MREILFRAKSLHFNKWIEGYYAKGDKDCIVCFGEAGIKWQAVKPETVGQFTGLTDKNGRKIFEGDILAIKFYPQYVNRVCWDGPPDAIAKVFWDFSGFRLNATNGKDRRYPALVDVNFKETEVIGNIHDNPELLGGADNG